MGGREGVLRPLLGTSRSDIRKWMSEHGRPWREDRTNSDSGYRRNLIRNEVFPLFERINPSFIRTLNADMRRFAQADEIAEEYLRAAMPEVLLPDGSISISALKADRHREFLLWRLLEDSGISAEEFASLCKALEDGRQIAGKRYGPVTGASGRLIVGQAAAPAGVHTEILDRSELKSLKQEKGVLVADADRIPMPLKIRPWRPGDWMVPLGMRGRKKISDMFTDLHVPLTEKERALVLELDGSRVAALIGVRIDDSVKVTDATARILRITLK